MKLQSGVKLGFKLYFLDYNIFDIIENNDSIDNKLPETEKIPFDIQGDQCVIAYSKEGKEGFFKIEKLTKKQMEAYPMQMKQ